MIIATNLCFTLYAHCIRTVKQVVHFFTGRHTPSVSPTHHSYIIRRIKTRLSVLWHFIFRPLIFGQFSRTVKITVIIVIIVVLAGFVGIWIIRCIVLISYIPIRKRGILIVSGMVNRFPCENLTPCIVTFDILFRPDNLTHIFARMRIFRSTAFYAH